MRPRHMRRSWIGACLVILAAVGGRATTVVAQTTTTYQVQFQGNWTTASTPGGVVSSAHFTTLIGAVHGSGVTFWESGQKASSGVEQVAELGSIGTFKSEIQASTHTLSVIQQGVSGGGTGSATFNITVNKTHPLVTLLSMIGPSPDWFVGVSGVSLLDNSNEWMQSLVVDLFPYDAGTEDGTEFTLSNPATNPQGVITSIKGEGKFSSVRMARLTFTRQVPAVSFASASKSVGEGSGTNNVKVNLSPAPTSNITVKYTVGGTATSSDFSITGSGTLSVSSGATTATIPVAITDDTAEETAETVILTLTNGTGYGLGSTKTHTLTITDNDTPVASFASASKSVGEGSGTNNVTVNLSPAPTSNITVKYTVGGTATSSDFSITGSGTLSVSSGASSATIPVAITDDTAEETAETVILTLTTGTGYALGSTKTHTLTITDNDTPVASFASASQSVGEGSGTNNVTVNLSPAPTSNITVNYSVSGTATSGDYSITGSGTLSVSSGASTATIPVAITDDTAQETAETVILTLTTGTGYAVGSTKTHTLTITDNDDPVASFASASQSVGEGSGTNNVTVNLSPAPISNITISYSVGGTATSGDFSITGSGTLSVSSGASSATIPVAITDDTAQETAETIILTLTTGTGYTLGSTKTHTLTITDNDTPAASFASASKGVGEGSGTNNVTVNLNPAPASNITVTYSVSGTATSDDYSITGSGTLSVSSGASTATIPVAITDDTAEETAETVILTLTTGTGYVLGSTKTHTLTITDNDMPVASFASASQSAGEGSGTRNVMVNFSPAPTSNISVTYSVGGTATSDDFSITGSGTLSVSSGASSASIPVAITDDTAEENAETVILTLTAGTGYALGSTKTHTLTITDNDAPPPTPVASFASASQSAGEGSGTRNVMVNLSPAPTSNITVTYGVGGTATSDDFSIIGSGTLSVSSGTSAASIPVAITDDTAEETAETIILTLTTGTGYTVGSTNSHTLNVTDNDATTTPIPVASFASASQSAGEGAGARDVMVNLNPAPTSNITVTYSVGGTTTNSDFSITDSGTLSIPSGTSAARISVAISDDDAPEDAETVILTLTAGTGYTVGGTNSHTLTITDNDAPPPVASFASASQSAGEGSGTRNVMVNLDPAPTSDITVTYSVGGTATSGDFSITGLGALSVPSGASSATIPVAISDDDAPEDAETVILTLTASTDYTVGSTNSHTLTITDNDGGNAANRPPTVSVSCGSCAVARRGSLRVTTTASDPDNDPLTYTWQASQGSFDGPVNGPTVLWIAQADVGLTTIRVTVSDGNGGVAFDEVEVRTFNRPPFFEGGTHAFELAENASGEVNPIELGTVAATDPDGDALAYELASGDDERFVVEAKSGTITYIGPGEDFEVEPNHYELTLAARDDLGAVAEVMVTVTVVAVNEAPDATDDNAIVAEDESVTIDVLTNDTDPDPGDVLQIKSVSDAENGTVQILGASVVYAPDPNYHGPDRFTYVVADNDALTDSAAVFVTVTPVNDAPTATDDNTTVAEDESVTIDVLTNDTDPDPGDVLQIKSVSDAENGTVQILGASVVYTPDPNYHGPDRFTYVVTDSDALTDSAAVLITVAPVNDAPTATDDNATVAEDENVTIDVLMNDTDPDAGDELQIQSVSDAENGTVQILGASVVYAPDPNYHGPDRFTYVVADSDALTDTAAVLITVAPVNDAPTATDDNATVAEDENVTIDVLANDTDPDSGDELQIKSVSGADNGTVQILGASVMYAPNPNYHGPDRFTYVVVDSDALTDSAAVSITVAPVNDAPEAVGAIEAPALEEGGDAATIMLLPYFTDQDGDPLTFEAASSDLDVVTAAVTGSMLTLTPAGYGSAVVTVTATDPAGLTAMQLVTVTVGDGMTRAILDNTLAAMARSHIASVRMTLRRKVAMESAGPAGLQLDGRPIPLDWTDAWEALRRVATGWMPEPLAMTHRLAASGARGAFFSSMPAPLQTLRNLGRRPSEFHLGWGGADPQARGLSGVRWSLWGQGDLQNFAGAPDAASQYDGRLHTGHIGLDARLTDRWMAGLALARSSGAGNWTAGSAEGRMTTSLTALHPYVRWSDGKTTIWSTVGGGWGNARNERKAQSRTGSSSLRLGLGIVEVQRRVVTVTKGLELGMHADAAWSRLATDEGDESIDNLSASVHQVRLGVDARGDLRASDLSMQPFGEINLRRDGGAGQTGNGLEIAGGLHASMGIFRLELQGRWLAVHTANGYAESGAGLTFSMTQPGDEGLSFSASPRWGRGAAGSGMLWQDQLQRSQPAGPAANKWAIDTRGEYRLRIWGDNLISAFGTWSQGPGGGRLELGGRMHFHGGRARPKKAVR